MRICRIPRDRVMMPDWTLTELILEWKISLVAQLFSGYIHYFITVHVCMYNVTLHDVLACSAKVAPTKKNIFLRNIDTHLEQTRRKIWGGIFVIVSEIDCLLIPPSGGDPRCVNELRMELKSRCPVIY
jgi:hypothetical protein